MTVFYATAPVRLIAKKNSYFGLMKNKKIRVIFININSLFYMYIYC